MAGISYVMRTRTVLVLSKRQCPIENPSHFRNAIHVLATAQVAGSLVIYENLSIALAL